MNEKVYCCRRFVIIQLLTQYIIVYIGWLESDIVVNVRNLYKYDFKTKNYWHCIELWHSTIKIEHDLGVPFPIIVGYLNNESPILLGCPDEYDTPSWLLGKKFTGMLHQTTFKDMPSSLPTVNNNGRLSILHPMTEFDDSTLKYDINHGNGQVAKIFDKYNKAFK